MSNKLTILQPEHIEVDMTLGTLTFNKEYLENNIKAVETRYANLVIDDTQVKDAKKDMANLNKLVESLDRKRIDSANDFKKPILQFETDLKNMAKRVTDARTNIANQVKAYEDKVKEDKTNEVKTFFDEHAKENSLDFIKYEDAKVNVTLSASMKSLKETVTAFIDKTVNDLKLIETQTHKERVRAEYEKTLDVSQAILTVNNAVQREEELLARQQQETSQKAQELPQAEVKEVVIEKPKVILSITFTVTGTREEIVSVRDFMKERGIKYE